MNIGRTTIKVFLKTLKSNKITRLSSNIKFFNYRTNNIFKARTFS